MRKLFFLSLMVVSLHGFSQRITLARGSLGSLADQHSINLEFSYESNKVGRFLHDQEYVEYRKKELNEKDPGKGTEWAADWYADRTKLFEPMFTELFTKETGLTVNKDAPYTLIFSTTFTEPGFNVFVQRSNAYINGLAILVETANRNNALAEVEVVKAPGRTAGGYDFDSGFRIREAYAVAGRQLGRFVKSNKK